MELELWLFPDLYEMVDEGSKSLDVRVGYYSIAKIETGSFIRFKRRNMPGSILVRVTAIRDYPSLKTMFEAEDFTKIAPGYNPRMIDAKLRKLYAHLQQFGVYVIEFVKTGKED